MKSNRFAGFVRILVFAVFAVITITSASWPATIGVNVAGSENSWVTYPIASRLDYLKSKGVVLIRVPIAWEKLQTTLNGALSSTEITNLQSFLTLAASRSMQVIVDIHNYGHYNPNWAADAAANYGVTEVRATSGLVLGSSDLPISALQDLWTRLAKALAGHAGLAGYGIMNEPHDLGTGVWATAAQAVINSIREVDTNTAIYVPGDHWSNAQNWATHNPSYPLSDSANNLVYEAHLYFDSNGGGVYTQTYDQRGAYPTLGVVLVQPFLTWLRQNNAKGFLGEFAVPDDDPRWLIVLSNFLNTLMQNNVSGTYWMYQYPAYPDTYRSNSWWPPTREPSVSLVPYTNGQDKPQWGVITTYTKYTLVPPHNLRLVNQ